MMTKGEIRNEYGERIGQYWFDMVTNSFVLRLYGINRYGYTEQGIIDWCNRNECWWEEV